MDVHKLNKEYGKFNYNKVIENEYFSALEDVMTIPERFEKWMTPIGEGGFKALAERISSLRGEDTGAEDVSLLLSPTFMSSLRNDFINAKKWIAIAALNITNHALSQRKVTYVDVDKATDKDAPWLKGDIVLPHNTVEVNGKVYPSLSHIKDKKGDGKSHSRCAS